MTCTTEMTRQPKPRKFRLRLVTRDTTASMRSAARREDAVVRAVARGLSNAEIGAELAMSEGTVNVHASRALAKLNLTNRAAGPARPRRAGPTRPRRGPLNLFPAVTPVSTFGCCNSGCSGTCLLKRTDCSRHLPRRTVRSLQPSSPAARQVNDVNGPFVPSTVANSPFASHRLARRNQTAQAGAAIGTSR
ncbi:response regulator transcription factor [Saccharopolyspora spinosa]